MWKRKKLRQSGGTCGYFALANAINHFSPSNKRLSYNDVEKLLKSTIEKGYSNIGEIFHYDRLELVVKEFRDLNKQIDFDYKFVSFNKKLMNALCDNQAVVVNYCTFPQKRKGFFSNSHWIALVKARSAWFKGRENKIMILNSAKIKIKNIDEIHISVKNLKDKKFCWKEFLNSKGFKKHYLSNRIFKSRLNRYISKKGLDFKEKIDNSEYQKEHAIIEHDHSKCLLLTF